MTTRGWITVGPLLPAGLFIGTLLLYLATLTQVHTFDALSYVTSVERKPWTELFHPHHLAYGPLGALALTAGELLGYAGGAARPMQIVNAVAGALGVALLFRTARRATGRADVALAAALLLGGAYAYWYYAVEIEVYTVATLFLIVCLDLITLPGPRTLRRLLLLGLAQGGAVLFHQTNVLLCAPILVLFIADCRSEIADRRPAAVVPVVGRWMAYGLALALTVGLPYVWVMWGVSGFRSLDAALAWLTEYARTGWWGGPLTGETLAELGVGLAETLAQPGGVLVWLGLGAVAASTALARDPEGAKAPRREGPKLAAPLLVWLLVYVAFFGWWEPDNIEFWIASLPPLLLLLALLLARGRAWGWRSWAAITIAAAAAVVNYGSIERRGDPATDLQRVVARELAAQATLADLLVVPDGLIELYLPYYEGHENFVSLNQAIFDAGGDWGDACALVRRRVDAALHAGATALIAEEALRPPPELLARHRLAQQQVDACFAPYRSLLTPVDLPDEVPAYVRLPRAEERAEGPGWQFDAFALGWEGANLADAAFDGGWRFRPGVDAALTGPLMQLDAQRYRAIEVRLSNGTAARDAQIFFAGPDGSIAEERSARWTLAETSAPVTYTIPLEGAPGWEGIITRLRIDPVGVGDGGVVRVEWVRLVRVER